MPHVTPSASRPSHMPAALVACGVGRRELVWYRNSVQAASVSVGELKRAVALVSAAASVSTYELGAKPETSASDMALRKRIVWVAVALLVASALAQPIERLKQ